MSTTSHVTGILGAGVMGETLLSGLVRAGRPVAELLVGEKRPERARELEEKYAVSVVSNLDATKRADTLALVVKPQAASPVGDTAISPPVPPSWRMSSSVASRADCKLSPPRRTRSAS